MKNDQNDAKKSKQFTYFFHHYAGFVLLLFATVCFAFILFSRANVGSIVLGVLNVAVLFYFLSLFLFGWQDSQKDDQ